MYPWGDARPYHSYAAYCRRTFGRPIQKLPVDGGFTCPNRDGTVGHGGCSFCSNEAFTPAYCDPRRTVRQQVDDAIAFHRRGFPAGTGFLVYFQSYSNTYAPLERLQRLFGEALACPGVAGIVVGTRPDCVDAAKLDYLADLARRTYVCVEYGIESTSDATLRTIDRGHDFAAARRAVEAMADQIIATTRHSATILDATGWYSKEDIKVVVVVCRKRETSQLLKLVRGVDGDAFISVGSVMGVYGKGFEALNKV